MDPKPIIALAWIAALPALGAVTHALLLAAGDPWPRLRGALGLLLTASAAVLALGSFNAIRGLIPPRLADPPIEWLALGPQVLRLELVLDPVSGLLALAVTGIALPILATLGRDHQSPRHLAALALTLLAVLGNSLLLVGLGWSLTTWLLADPGSRPGRAFASEGGLVLAIAATFAGAATLDLDLIHRAAAIAHGAVLTEPTLLGIPLAAIAATGILIAVLGKITSVGLLAPPSPAAPSARPGHTRHVARPPTTPDPPRSAPGSLPLAGHLRAAPLSPPALPPNPASALTILLAFALALALVLRLAPVLALAPGALALVPPLTLTLALLVGLNALARSGQRPLIAALVTIDAALVLAAVGLGAWSTALALALVAMTTAPALLLAPAAQPSPAPAAQPSPAPAAQPGPAPASSSPATPPPSASAAPSPALAATERPFPATPQTFAITAPRTLATLAAAGATPLGALPALAALLAACAVAHPALAALLALALALRALTLGRLGAQSSAHPSLDPRGARGPAPILPLNPQDARDPTHSLDPRGARDPAHSLPLDPQDARDPAHSLHPLEFAPDPAADTSARESLRSHAALALLLALAGLLAGLLALPTLPRIPALADESVLARLLAGPTALAAGLHPAPVPSPTATIAAVITTLALGVAGLVFGLRWPAPRRDPLAPLTTPLTGALSRALAQLARPFTAIGDLALLAADARERLAARLWIAGGADTWHIGQRLALVAGALLVLASVFCNPTATTLGPTAVHPIDLGGIDPLLVAPRRTAPPTATLDDTDRAAAAAAATATTPPPQAQP